MRHTVMADSLIQEIAARGRRRRCVQAPATLPRMCRPCMVWYDAGTRGAATTFDHQNSASGSLKMRKSRMTETPAERAEEGAPSAARLTTLPCVRLTHGAWQRPCNNVASASKSKAYHAGNRTQTSYTATHGPISSLQRNSTHQSERSPRCPAGCRLRGRSQPDSCRGGRGGWDHRLSISVGYRATTVTRPCINVAVAAGRPHTAAPPRLTGSVVGTSHATHSSRSPHAPHASPVQDHAGERNHRVQLREGSQRGAVCLSKVEVDYNAVPA